MTSLHRQSHCGNETKRQFINVHSEVRSQTGWTVLSGPQQHDLPQELEQTAVLSQMSRDVNIPVDAKICVGDAEMP